MIELDWIVCECAWKSVKSSAYRLELSSLPMRLLLAFFVGSKWVSQAAKNRCSATQIALRCQWLMTHSGRPHYWYALNQNAVHKNCARRQFMCSSVCFARLPIITYMCTVGALVFLCCHICFVVSRIDASDFNIFDGDRGEIWISDGMCMASKLGEMVSFVHRLAGNIELRRQGRRRRATRTGMGKIAKFCWQQSEVPTRHIIRIHEHARFERTNWQLAGKT